MLKDKRAVIFDLEGTLVDSMWIWREIDERFLGQYGLQVPDGLNDFLEGFSFKETAEYFKNNFPLPLSVQEIKDTDVYKRQVYGISIFLEKHWSSLSEKACSQKRRR